jgi:hypothetical protein
VHGLKFLSSSPDMLMAQSNLHPRIYSIIKQLQLKYALPDRFLPFSGPPQRIRSSLKSNDYANVFTG